jgi:hypothetical protein
LAYWERKLNALSLPPADQQQQEHQCSGNSLPLKANFYELSATIDARNNHKRQLGAG